MTSWKTTLCGILAIIGGGMTQFFHDVPWMMKLGGFLATTAPAVGLLFARDNKTTSEQALGLPRKIVGGVLMLAVGLSVLFTGCASYKAAGVVTVTAEKAMESWAHYYDVAIASPADYATTAAKLKDQRRDVDKAWEAYRFAMNAVDDTRLAGGDVKAALATAQARSGDFVRLVLTFLPQQFKPR